MSNRVPSGDSDVVFICFFADNREFRTLYSSVKRCILINNYRLLSFSYYIQNTRDMTKILEWLSALSAVFAVWYSLIGGYVKHPMIEKNMTIILISPIIFVILFGLYAVTVVLYRVLTFNNCEKAAKELQAEIVEAKKDLHDRGLRW